MVLIAEYCWSYVKHEDSYITVSGLQVRTIKTLPDALTLRDVRRESGMHTEADVAHASGFMNSRPSQTAPNPATSH
jgi:hypothetical protein